MTNFSGIQDSSLPHAPMLMCLGASQPGTTPNSVSNDKLMLKSKVIYVFEVVSHSLSNAHLTVTFVYQNS